MYLCKQFPAHVCVWQSRRQPTWQLALGRGCVVVTLACREAAAAGMPVAVQPLPRGSSSSRAARGGSSSAAGGGRKRGRGRADAAGADDEGDDALGYKGSQ
jgi:hypothetical protein